MSDALAGFPLLAALDPDDADRLAQRLEHVEVPSGHVLFREGEPADALWLIAEGSVRLSSRAVPDAGTCGPGRALGALALVEKGERETTAEALSRCRLLCLRRGTFDQLVAGSPRIACALALAVARESAGALRDALSALRAPRAGAGIG